MKVLKKIKKIFLIIVCSIFLCFAVFFSVLLLSYNKFGVTQFDTTSLIVVNGKISAPNYKKGDLVFVKEKELNNIKEGEELFVYKLDGHGTVNIVVGEVDRVSLSDDGVKLKNGGDYSSKFIAGTAYKVYHDIGLYLSIIESKWGFLFIILVPLFFIFIYQVYALIVEIKYGRDDEDDGEEENIPETKKTVKKEKEKKVKKKPLTDKQFEEKTKKEISENKETIKVEKKEESSDK